MCDPSLKIGVQQKKLITFQNEVRLEDKFYIKVVEIEEIYNLHLYNFIVAFFI